MRPKYSIILPTLNGARTLALTLPAMLKCERDDVEWVLSENHSDDDTWSLLKEIAADDDRVRLVRPRERLPLGKHLEFAYQQASGRWLSHLGDDDHLVPWRFDLLDQVLEQASEQCGLIRGEYVRYSWPEYPEAQLANSVDPSFFTGRCEFISGSQFARQLLNRVHIHGGGAWVVRSDVAARVRERCGWFASPQHVEFFAMRAAACVAQEVAVVSQPLFILGRHSKSSGTQYFLPKKTNAIRTWDWSFEDPENYAASPFDWKSYSTLSLDAALAVRQHFAAELAGVAIDWRTWLKAIHSEMMQLIAYEQLPPAARQDFLSAIARLPGASSLYWRWRTWRLQWQHWWRGTKPADTTETPALSPYLPSGLLATRVHGEQAGFHSIDELAHWLRQWQTCFTSLAAPSSQAAIQSHGLQSREAA